MLRKTTQYVVDQDYIFNMRLRIMIGQNGKDVHLAVVHALVAMLPLSSVIKASKI